MGSCSPVIARRLTESDPLKAYRQRLHAPTWILSHLRGAKATTSRDRRCLRLMTVSDGSVWPQPCLIAISATRATVSFKSKEGRTKTLTLLAGVRVRRHLHVVGRQQARDPVHLSFPPIRVGLVHDVDELTFGEAQLVLIGGGVVVHGDHLAH